jgi:LDH2 family malate/lactate/ureidoglycolate dehydrogenase
VPTGRETPLVIDMATSACSMGQVVRAARDGALLDGKFVVDTKGSYGNWPAKIVLDVMQRESRMAGALLPAGYKGFAWMLLVEVLSNLLSGERAWIDERPATPGSRPEFYGMCLVAIDVSHFMPPDEFRTASDRMVRTLAASVPAQNFDAIRLPGARAAEAEKQRRTHGIPVRDEEWAMVEDLIDALALDAD